MALSKIIYTKCNKTPLLATYSNFSHSSEILWLILENPAGVLACDQKFTAAQEDIYKVLSYNPECAGQLLSFLLDFAKLSDQEAEYFLSVQAINTFLTVKTLTAMLFKTLKELTHFPERLAPEQMAEGQAGSFRGAG